MMFRKEDATDTVSPNCIMGELRNTSETFRGLPVVPDMMELPVESSSISCSRSEAVPPRPCLETGKSLHRKRAKSVSFQWIPSKDVGDFNVTHCCCNVKEDLMLDDDNADASYYSNGEIQEFYKQARRQAKCYSMRNKKEGASSLMALLQRLYQVSETESQLSAILNGKTASELLEVVGAHQESRGLEPFLCPCIKRQRAIHVQGVLKIQNALRAHTLDQDTVFQVLRTRSLQTSRASRVLSRLLAHGDYLQLTQILREELQQQDAVQSRSTPCITLLGSSILSS